MQRVGFALALAGVLALGNEATGAPSFVFTRIADQDTDIPGVLGLLPSFRTFSAPAIDGGQVAFRGDGWTDFTGILIWDSTGLTIVADHTTLVPGMGSTKFQGFGPPAIRGGKVAFVGGAPLALISAKAGVYSDASGTLQAVADSNTAIPGSSLGFNYFEPSRPGFDLGSVAFVAGNLTAGPGATFNAGGVYTNLYGSLGAVADLSTAVPGSTAPFSYFGLAQLEGTRVAFGAVSFAIGRTGLYTTGPGLTTVVDTATKFPGLGSDIFDSFSAYSLSGGSVAFVGCGPDCKTQYGIFAATFAGSSLTTLVNRYTPIPGLPPGAGFDRFDQVSLDGGFLAFSAEDTGVDGLYRLDLAQQDLQRIVRTGDPLDGGKVATLEFGSAGLSGPDIVFRATFSDGNDGLYRASEGGSILVGDVPGGTAQVAALPCLLCPRIDFDALRVFGLALGDRGLGVDEPVWIDGPQARLVDYAATGSRFASYTPPVGVDEDGRFDLWLPVAGSGRLVDSGIDLFEGQPFGLPGGEGVERFRIGGIDPLPRPPDDDAPVDPSFPAAVTFTGIDTVVEVSLAPVLEPEIDVRPRSDRNRIRASSRGAVPVALLGSGTFDVERVDRSSLRFGPAGAVPIHRRLGHLKDVNRDGVGDLLLHFRPRKTGLSAADAEACLEGTTDYDQAFLACQAVEVRGTPRHE
jgi:hypothetical protein